jgi:hypothetical protein
MHAKKRAASAHLAALDASVQDRAQEIAVRGRVKHEVAAHAYRRHRACLHAEFAANANHRHRACLHMKLLMPSSQRASLLHGMVEAVHVVQAVPWAAHELRGLLTRDLLWIRSQPRHGIFLAQDEAAALCLRVAAEGERAHARQLPHGSQRCRRRRWRIEVCMRSRQGYLLWRSACKALEAGCSRVRQQSKSGGGMQQTGAERGPHGACALCQLHRARHVIPVLGADALQEVVPARCCCAQAPQGTRPGTCVSAATKRLQEANCCACGPSTKPGVWMFGDANTTAAEATGVCH